MNKKVSLTTLGCKLNQYDSEAILTQFRHAGYEVVEAGDPADICVVNTCAVTSVAERKARTIIRSTRRRNPQATVLAVGCMVERTADSLAAMPEVNAVLGNREKEHLIDFLNRMSAGSSGHQFVGETRAAAEFTDGVVVTGLLGRTRSFLKVQDGCSQKCTYCIVPQLRGPGRSLSIPAVVERARVLADHGFAELVLTGVALGTYGFDLGNRGALATLLFELEKVEGLKRIRLGSVEPWAISDRMLDVVAGSTRICPHLHIPLQSGEDGVLHRMNRRYSTKQIEHVFDYAYGLRDDWGFGSDIIVGFPGESRNDFEQTCRFLSDLPLSYLHIFPYSTRPGTPATRLPGQVGEQEKRTRAGALAEIDQRKRMEFRQRSLGRVARVLFENRLVGPLLAGHSDNYLDVYVTPAAELPGRIRSVKLVDLHPAGVVGEIID
ncbi:tRNA (N(6)-L-threonylcarbamoyladenosine(37)-C(2))-methylthiotransferase MtaB [candidate division KSB1 bacterium]|nr:tRNA (N(6)-L-threonylcarbamoyladenosine(37)-C(2))-methylthiotransferase MtaB [candidate division KSB1 bacterium]